MPSSNTQPAIAALLAQRIAAAFGPETRNYSSIPMSPEAGHEAQMSLLNFLAAVGKNRGAGVRAPGAVPMGGLNAFAGSGPQTDVAREFARFLQGIHDRSQTAPRNPQVFNDFAYRDEEPVVQPLPPGDVFNSFAYQNPTRSHQQIFDSMYRRAPGVVPQSYTG